MNIKSLLIGSAALATVSTGAQAADAIVMAEPEPMEYVRICDVYGAGFFYIPGTETCLKIGGYMRYEIQYNTVAAAGLTKLARFQANFDARSDSEVGTIRGYAAVNFDWGFAPLTGPAGAYGVTTAIDSAFIQVIRPNGGSWLFGREAAPYARFQGFGFFTINGGYYGFRRTSEISYSYAGSNGFNFIAALTTDGNVNLLPDAEIGIRFDRGWGSVGLMAGYDIDVGTFGAKAWTRVKFGNSGVSGALAVLYSSGPGAFAIAGPALIPAAGGPAVAAPAVSTFSVLAGLQARFSPKVAANLHAQWFSAGGFDSALNLDFTVARGMNVIPEVRFDTANGIGAVVRIQRSF